MSTLSEIEAAIESLPTPQIEELAAWLDRRRFAKPAGSVGLPARSLEDFFGCFASGESRGADNARIDADLAREAAGGT